MGSILESIVIELIYGVLGLMQGEIFTLLLFFVLKYSIIFAAVMVVISTNAIYSVFYLILLFITVAILVIGLGAEFLGITFIIVYVGAIAVLFLFVVMMLNVNQEDTDHKSLHFYAYFFSSFTVLAVFSKYLSAYIYPYFGFQHLTEHQQYNSVAPIYSFFYHDWTNLIFKNDNILVLGSLLYTYYYHLFIIAGFILLVAMVSSIVLTLNYNRSAKAQDKYIQVTRQLSESVYKRY